MSYPAKSTKKVQNLNGDRHNLMITSTPSALCCYLYLFHLNLFLNKIPLPLIKIKYCLSAISASLPMLWLQLCHLLLFPAKNSCFYPLPCASVCVCVWVHLYYWCCGNRPLFCLYSLDLTLFWRQNMNSSNVNYFISAEHLFSNFVSVFTWK